MIIKFAEKQHGTSGLAAKIWARVNDGGGITGGQEHAGTAG
ncbi:MAG: hypothetical protein ABI231_00420 [Candidatus Tumulicola sp.]